MIDNESVSRLDEMERSNLQKIISDVETALAVSTPGTRAHLENLLRNVKARVGVLDKQIKDAETERAAQFKEEFSTAMAMAEREKALSASEQRDYAGLLEHEYFTKRDFGHLDRFYSSTWERLSEHGKDEMSHRIWEGVRRNEYTFTELPAAVKEAESGRVYHALTQDDFTPAQASAIPAADRQDFITAYGTGHHREAAEILNRESFTRNLATSSNGVLEPRQAAAANEAGIDGRVTELREAPSQTERPKPVGTFAEVDVAGLNLTALTLSDGTPSSAGLPPLQSNSAPAKSR